jgi:hypothetical protein
MPPIPYPQLDARDEEQVVADVIDALPPELSDRNPSSVVVKIVEACGAFYGLLLYKMNQLPQRMWIALLNLVGIEPEPATAAHVELTFTSAEGTVAPITVLAGTRVRSGFGVSAQEFITSTSVSVPEDGGSATVEATASAVGAAGNIAAGALVYLTQSIAGIASVTNADAAFGGQDAEALDATLARAPAALRNLGDRFVTLEDGAELAARVEGIERAKLLGATYLSDVLAIVVGGGAAAVGVLATDLNQTPSAGLTAAVEAALTMKSPPGLVVRAYQHPVRLIWVSSIELALEQGYTLVGIKPAVEATLAGYLDATSWEWGASLYENDLVVLLARVAGVRRVGAIEVKTSDTYGASWSAAEPLVIIAPGLAGDLTDAFGLLHYGEGFGTPGALALVAL